LNNISALKNTLYSIALLFIFLESAHADTFTCRLYDEQSNVIFQQIVAMVNNRAQLDFNQENIEIRAMALVELVVVQYIYKDVQVEAMGHLAAGVNISDQGKLLYYTLCEIKLGKL
jgi:hypothetical protein